MSHSTLLLASGGLDSTVCWWLLRSRGWRVTPLFIDFGQPAARGEWRAVEVVSQLAGVAPARLELKPSPYESFPTEGLLPARNLLLVSGAAAWTTRAGCRCLATGFIRDETPRTDNGKDFLRVVNATLAMTPPRCRVLAPLLARRKRDVVRLAGQLGAPIHLTVSCYLGVAGGCRSCAGCRDRERALAWSAANSWR